MKVHRSTLIAVLIVPFILLLAAGFAVTRNASEELIALTNENREFMKELEGVEKSLVWLKEEHRKNPYRGLRKIIATAYNSERRQTDSDPFITASGNRVQQGTLALSRDMINAENEFMERQGYNPWATISYGDTVELIYVRRMVVHDTMNKRYSNRADIWMESSRDARKWGKREVFIAPVGATQ